MIQKEFKNKARCNRRFCFKSDTIEVPICVAFAFSDLDHAFYRQLAKEIRIYVIRADREFHAVF